MKKIFNWVGGSFFRTIGRLLVYILLGYILALLLSNKNIKLPIFQVLNVDALESNLIAIDTNNQFLLTYNANLATNDEQNRTQSRDYVTYFSNNWSYCGQTFSAYQINSSFPSRNFNNNTYFSFSLPLGQLKQNYNYDIIIYGYYLPYDIEFEGMYKLSRVQNYPYTANKFNSTGTYYSTSTDFSACLKAQTYKINFDFNGPYNYALIQFKTLSSYSSTSPIFFGYEIVDKGPTTNLNDINSSLTDDSINENGVSDFTSGLNKEYSSLTPFSDFLNLPLTWIQSLFASGQNCTSIHLPLPYLNNKYLDLPCMTEFWQRMGAIGTLVQVVWIAIVGVRIFNGLFLLTCETIDPNPDKDMTKLRTWEL